MLIKNPTEISQDYTENCNGDALDFTKYYLVFVLIKLYICNIFFSLLVYIEIYIAEIYKISRKKIYY